ncbi:putative periplasmic serine endoprotease DegP-like precursor [Roseovarius albus]|uniref:Putative periplasmic serine endoprotease DegP-like n=1 Tax=Roseovarius albus TaxID=1247867 RepID=A0A1X7A347_9RHOB|nr:trypsin-like peptidase domain-containing protein [Roseovarius albus]SLN68727.1 putative periplasmic serine endoprotease DegP-like precursor [Roseovarius albus]
MLRLCVLLTLLLTPPALAETQVPKSQAEVSLSFVPVVKQAAPAVVNIYARIIHQGRRSPFQGDPFFEHFFKGFGDPRPRIENSLGSGVILTDDGIVVSNYHVVGMASEIRVISQDGREYDAEVLLGDQESDLAILRLKDASDLPYLELRNSDEVEVGELVLAIGNPFGVGQTVSSGIVSGLARSGTATGNSRGYFIQTDAPINPGNSGGALVDISGHLIGINTSILSRSGGSNGIGFAIPSALVAQFLDQMRDGRESFQRPWAGATGQPVTSDVADGLGLERPGGLILSQLHRQSPFREAGFEAGDIIAAVDGYTVNTPAEMIYRMSVAGIGKESLVTRIRDGQSEEIAVALMAAPETPDRGTITTGRKSPVPELVLSTINPAVIAEYNLPLMSEGAIVEDPGPVGARLGMRRGDVIAEVNGRPILNSDMAATLMRKARDYLRLDVMRGSRRLSLRYKL